MKRIIAFAFILVSIAASAQQRSLDQYRWKNRIMLIFGEEQHVTDQYNAFEKAGLNERDLVVIGVTNQVKVLNAEKPVEANLKGLTEKYLVPREKGRVAIPLKLILIGKDGTAKFSSEEPVAPDKIYEVIDAMPMRKREMKNSSGGDSSH